MIGTQANDITRDPNRKAESEMGNMVADALRAKYPEAEAAWTNSGGLRVDFLFTLAVRRRGRRRDHRRRDVRACCRSATRPSSRP